MKDIVKEVAEKCADNIDAHGMCRKFIEPEQYVPLIADAIREAISLTRKEVLEEAAKKQCIWCLRAHVLMAMAHWRTASISAEASREMTGDAEAILALKDKEPQ